MSSVEVVIRLHRVNGNDIESIQEDITDAVYALGFSRIEPVSATLVKDESSSPCGC